MYSNRLRIEGKASVIAVVVLTAVVFTFVGMQLGRRQAYRASEYESGTDSAAAHEGRSHGDDESAGLNRMCEHNVQIVDCDECRYEVGVVKIDEALAESLIETGTVEDVNQTARLKLTGQVELDSTRWVEVISTGAGRVEEVRKFLGEKVKKGDILAMIHSDDLGQAKADYLEIQAKLELAEATFKREKGLYEQKVTSEAEYLDALNELKAAEAVYAAADRRLRLFGLGGEEIKGIKEEQGNGEFSNLMLRAPQDGTIIAQNVSVGKITDTTESLYTITELANLWVWCDVYEKDLAAVQEQFKAEGAIPVSVHVKAFGSRAFEGVVDLVGDVMDEHTRTVKMRVQVKNPENKLKRGMFADVEVPVSLPEGIAAVPRAAVMSDAGKDFLFEHWRDNLWIRRDVSVGERHGELVEIRDGIARGARIVTGGAFMLKSDILREKMGAGCAD